MHGFLNLNKPLGWTSHDCVARLRRLLNTKKIGHAGTLDPLATGVLPIAVGRATRLLQYLPKRKAYRATIRFGLTTTTDDLEGDVLTEQSAERLTRQQVEAALGNFIGTIRQKPPMYSAVQLRGKRLYELARQGKVVDVPTREVVISQLNPQDWQTEPHTQLTVDIDCGPGTYIRSLARDLGAAVGTGATLAGLCRTYSNGFGLSDSITLEALQKVLAAEPFSLVPAGKAVAHLDAIALPPDLARRWCLGQKLALSAEALHLRSNPSNLAGTVQVQSRPFRVMMAETDVFLGIGEIRNQNFPGETTEQDLEKSLTREEDSGGLLVPKRVFVDAADLKKT
ncbi:MAG: tRNA pseudouridine(55) synthase TruB [Cyanobacteria bacterium J06607_13]